MFFERSSILLLIITFVSHIQSDELTKDEELPKFECHVDGSRCDLKGIRITKDKPFFKVLVDDPTKITELYVSESFMPVLSKSICDTFPSLTRLHVDNVGVKFVRRNAFEKCTKLEEINLANNKIKTLKPETFVTNAKLKTLSLSNNLLSELPENVLDALEELQFLHLQNNHLKEFNVDLLKKNKKLEAFYIFTNDLTDLDIETLHSELPKLKSIHANNNPFPCKRVRRMALFAETKQFDLSRKYQGERTRDYKVDTFDEFLCKPKPVIKKDPPPSPPPKNRFMNTAWNAAPRKPESLHTEL